MSRLGETKFLTQGLEHFGPGEKRQVLLDRGSDRAASDLPLVIAGQVSYKAPGWIGTRKWRERFRLDLDTWMDANVVRDKGVHEIAEALEKLGESLAQ